MRINVTFIIQIINFWISYFMLHKFLFKPFIHLINSKEFARATLIQGLKTKKQQLLQLQEDKKGDLETFKTYIRTQYPFKIQPLEKISSQYVFMKNIEELNALINTEKILLLEKAGQCMLK